MKLQVSERLRANAGCECLPTNDSAEISSEPGYVIIEANEWDNSGQRLRSVTLRICLHEARLMANTIRHRAAESEMLRRWIN